MNFEDFASIEEAMTAIKEEMVKELADSITTSSFVSESLAESQDII